MTVAAEVKHQDNMVRMAALEQRVTGIESSINQVAAAVATVNDKLDRRSSTNWPVLWSAAGVCTTILVVIGGLVYRPLDTSMMKLDAKMERFSEQLVTRSEHERQWSQADRFLDGVRDRVGRLERAVERNEDHDRSRMDRIEGRLNSAPPSR